MTMTYTTLAWKRNALYLLDQTKLPRRHVVLACRDAASVFRAIRALSVRGAPAIGVAGGFGLYLAVRGARGKREFFRTLERAVSYLRRARPTAVNLEWALGRMRRHALSCRQADLPQLKSQLLGEAKAILLEEKERCERMARFGAALIRSGDTILTHCNTGALAT
ncbi:MAG: S-methyl-5-thioribose-1-phosphate isomerase, partial [Candidatus Omnitrophota bacterium]